MAADDPIPPDASTVYRSANDPGSTRAPNTPSHDQLSDEDSDRIAQAKTVIRGGDAYVPPPRSSGRTPADVSQVLLGQHLDHFLLEEMIGGGGMGAVFRAHDDQLDRTVAIKVIPFVSDDPDLQRRFKNEAQSAAKLDHPRIASIYGVGHRDDWHYIVFEYIRGTNIRDFVSSAGTMHIDDAVFYTCELAAALQHAADRGIVHRDIKPSNVLITEDDNIKLVDMGLARSENFDVTEDLTASGVTLGTFDYISPEQAKDPRDADLRSDIYSLGCTLYFMLTSSPPYPGGTMLQKLLSHGNSPPPDARAMRPSVSHSLSSVIQRMLAKDPDDRYQTATELIADLREVAFEEDLPRSQGVAAVVVRRKSNPLVPWLQQHAPWLIAGFILLVSAGVLELTATGSQLVLTPPETAKFPESFEQETEPAVPEIQPRIDEPEVSADPVVDIGASNVADPPSLAGLPIPEELSDDLIGAESPAVAPVLGDAETMALQTPFGPDSLMVDDVIAPKVIRVVGLEEAADLLPDPRQRYRAGVLQSRSLAQAVEEAERFNVRRIEITSPIIYSEPVDISTDGLLIASTIGGGSTVVFESDHRSVIEPEQMLSIGSNKIEIDDLHFVWDVPSSAFNGGALIRLSANKMVRLTDCSITINNPDSQEEVYAFSVVNDPLQTNSIAALDSVPFDELPLVSIELNNVVVRGPETMISMDFSTQLQLEWENGLLAVTKRLLDTRGARVLPTVGPIQLSLIRLTSHTPQGLVRMRLEDEGLYPMMIDRVAQNCVFIVDSNASHFDISGLDSYKQSLEYVSLRGEGNVYDINDAMDVILMLTDRSGRPKATRAEDVQRNLPDWFTEKSTRWRADWSPEHSQKIDVERVTTDNYQQYGAVEVGFDADLLPTLPVLPRRVGGGERRPDELESP